MDTGLSGLGLFLEDSWTCGRGLGAAGGLADPPGGQKGLRGHLLEAGLHGSLWGTRPEGHLKSLLDWPGVAGEGQGVTRGKEGLA